MSYIHDITDAMIEAHLKEHRVMHVGDEHFCTVNNTQADCREIS